MLQYYSDYCSSQAERFIYAVLISKTLSLILDKIEYLTKDYI